ncbi:MAG: type II toxin-antitoxin system death-on-curing family toxin [Verrucomicrobia bacterium]|nr:type II toxin-antitoxin system death-on-curing family toxin [Verrucomicrobiota bacterium]
MIKYLTVDQVIYVHDHLLSQHGGLAGIRDLGLLISALEMPKSAFHGEEIHPTLFDKAAAYLFHIARNHPFNDGNKRTAAFAACLFLRINNFSLKIDQTEYELIVIATAEGLLSKPQIRTFLANASKKGKKKGLSKKRKRTL